MDTFNRLSGENFHDSLCVLPYSKPFLKKRFATWENMLPKDQLLFYRIENNNFERIASPASASILLKLIIPGLYLLFYLWPGRNVCIGYVQVRIILHRHIVWSEPLQAPGEICLAWASPKQQRFWSDYTDLPSDQSTGQEADFTTE